MRSTPVTIQWFAWDDDVRSIIESHREEQSYNEKLAKVFERHDAEGPVEGAGLYMIVEWDNEKKLPAAGKPPLYIGIAFLQSVQQRVSQYHPAYSKILEAVEVDASLKLMQGVVTYPYNHAKGTLALSKSQLEDVESLLVLESESTTNDKESMSMPPVGYEIENTGIFPPLKNAYSWSESDYMDWKIRKEKE